MWPHLIDLDIGESRVVETSFGPEALTLLDVEDVWEPDHWIEGNDSRQTVREAKITVDVSGVRHGLRMRPYEMPACVNGLRLYVEATHASAVKCQYAPLQNMHRAVRLSVLDGSQHWGPEGLRFPVRNYRWRSSTYNNTWGSLVPYNQLYYHRGEDFGAIPDALDVVSIHSGTVSSSPLPAGGGSNTVAVTSNDGLEIRYGHMNLETIDPGLRVGARVEAGQTLGKTGCTWSGRRAQHLDPHLHVGFHRQDTPISAYPMLVEAYLRDYDDPLLAVAGGYLFATPGQRVTLDGSRSIARPGREIASHRWRLHDGTTVDGPVAQVRYDQPGLFSEELIVRADDGSEDRDFAQVRVYDRSHRRDLAFGWTYHLPVRGVRAGEAVKFWNRQCGMAGPVEIDFGDGTCERTSGTETEHRYRNPGLYVVTLHGIGPGSQPITLKMRVVVDDPA